MMNPRLMSMKFGWYLLSHSLRGPLRRWCRVRTDRIPSKERAVAKCRLERGIPPPDDDVDGEEEEEVVAMAIALQADAVGTWNSHWEFREGEDELMQEYADEKST
jgi:hypothetical protein